MTERNVILKFTRAEALVLFECLASLVASPKRPWKLPSEATVFSRLLGQLESTLAEPFAPNYNELVAQARMSVDAGER